MLENGADRLGVHRAATDLQFVKHTISTENNEVRHNKTRYACFCHGVKFGFPGKWEDIKTWGNNMRPYGNDHDGYCE